MNVLIVHPCKGFYGGAEEVVVQLVNYLEADEHEVRIITKDAPIGEFTGGRWLHNSKSWPEFRTWTQRQLEWADVVNVHNAPAPLTTFPKKVPTVYMCNEPMELFTNWRRKPIEAFNRWWVKKSGMKVVVADQMNAHRFQRLYGVEPTVIPYGVDYDFWSKGDSYQGDDGRTLKLLQVGTITPYKNQLKSICMLAELLSEGIDASLTLVGSYTADVDYSAQLMSDYIPYIDKEEISGFKDRITFTGQQTQEEVRNLYHQHDLLFHPVEGQGGWLVPFEAMCAGLPVVTEPGFSASHLIASNKLGVVGNTDGTATVEAILSGEWCKLDVAAIRSWVKKNLTWEKFGKGIVETLEEAIHYQTEQIGRH